MIRELDSISKDIENYFETLLSLFSMMLFYDIKQQDNELKSWLFAQRILKSPPIKITGIDLKLKTN